MNRDVTEQVRTLFNGMADEYDRLLDLWYPYVFGEIDRILIDQCAGTGLAVDIGCGTGIQSVRLTSLGYRVVGVDIAEALLDRARGKLPPSRFRAIRGDARSLPIDGGVADFAVCCGPTLSFVVEWQRALSEVARILKRGARFLLEVEGKWNLDLLWSVVNAFIGNRLRYDESISEAMAHLLPPWHRGHRVSYPFPLESGETASMPVRLFTPAEIAKTLRDSGLRPERWWGIHALTNLIPSTLLSRPDPTPWMRRLFGVLSSLERRLRPSPSIANSILVLARKGAG